MSYFLGENKGTGYSSISAIYDISRKANSETVQKLMELLHFNSEMVFLDMGCGTGNYLAAIMQISKDIIGIDISMSMLEQARKKAPYLQLICGDVTSLPFATETFSGAFAIQILHHLRKKADFLRETRRVLKTGSYVAIHSCSHSQMGAFWFYHYFPKCLEIDLARIPDTCEICFLLEKSGFSNIGVEICYHDTVVSNETPERYLDKNYRNGVSTFAFLTDDEIELGCDKIRQDMSSGDVYRVVQQCEAKVLNEVGGSSIIYGQKRGQVCR
jgi:ubiquinone/menaquinone biosynthesis C-methylase UbiE